MQLTLKLDIAPLPEPIKYEDELFLIGSCFSENMSERLQQHKFRTLSNPHGILFNPLSIAHSLRTYTDRYLYRPTDLFYLNELYNSWDHHTRFSHIDAAAALDGMNQSQQQASEKLEKANWVIITLGSAFHYILKETGKPVANNHRAPAQWFEKRLSGIDDIIATLSDTITHVRSRNPGARFLFTVSPVRHIRDGVIDNNRSKARLIEAVHALCARHTATYYFPSYELVIDILRDYRFYDIDFVHPNYLATNFVWDHFVQTCMDADTVNLMSEIKDITQAVKHRPRFPETAAHRKFCTVYAEKARSLIEKYPYIDLKQELDHFSV